jgi:hypothetical protein
LAAGVLPSSSLSHLHNRSDHANSPVDAVIILAFFPGRTAAVMPLPARPSTRSRARNHDIYLRRSGRYAVVSISQSLDNRRQLSWDETGSGAIWLEAARHPVTGTGRKL